jgi:formate hydrogenlyase transcriptional activator
MSHPSEYFVMHESVQNVETRPSSKQYRDLLEVSEAIVSTRELSALFKDLAGLLHRVVRFDYLWLNLRDGAGDALRLRVMDPPNLAPSGTPIPVQDPATWVWQNQQPVVASSLAEAAGWRHYHPWAQRLNLNSLCVLPLTTAGHRLGSVSFGCKQLGVYHSRDVDFLRLVANQVAVAVDNALNNESALASQQRLARERDRLGLLLEVSESIASHRDLDEMFRDLGKRLPRIVPFDYINLLLHDPERNVMRLHLLAAPESSTIRPSMELPINETSAGLVWKSQQPFMVEDVATETRFPKLMSQLRENDVQSYCTVPLTSALRRLGAMSFGSLQRRVYQEVEVNFMQQVAKQVALAVDNVLHDESARFAQEQLTRERDRMRLLLEVNNALVSHLDLNDLFTAVSDCLRKVIQHDSSALVLCDQETRWYRVHTLNFAKNESFIEEGRIESDGCMKSPAAIAASTLQPEVFGEEDLKTMAAESPCAQYFLAEGVKAFCSVPLLSRDRALGALTVARCREETFSPKDIELLSEVAKQIAIAVENAQAYREITELKDKLAKEKLYLEEEVRTEYSFAEIVGHSETLRRTLKAVETVAPTDSVVLIQGETGTGKELIARAIHNLSARRVRTLVKLNCAAIPSGLLESELFGHEKGAFTGAVERRIGRFEVAHKGTLFLDEVGDIPLELQPKLLRVLQEQEFERLGSSRTVRVDVRVIAATNRDLAQMVADNQFRADLYYRLNVFPVRIPPLRERPEDIPLLVAYFTQHHARRLNKRIESIPAEAMEALQRHAWAGNVRELENFIERAVIITRGSHLQIPLAELKTEAVANGSGKIALPARLVPMEEMERTYIEEVLRRTGGQIGGAGGAAEILGLPVSTLRSRMKKLGIRFAR